MSFTGDDPHIKYQEKGILTDPLDSKAPQWPRVRRAGFGISIHCQYGQTKYEAWVKADDLEAYLTPNLGPDISDENPQETKAP